MFLYEAKEPEEAPALLARKWHLSGFQMLSSDCPGMWPSTYKNVSYDD